MYSTCLCAKFQPDPSEPHLVDVQEDIQITWKVLIILGYGIQENQISSWVGYSDADFRRMQDW